MDLARVFPAPYMVGVGSEPGASFGVIVNLTAEQLANLKRVRISPILVRGSTHRRAGSGPGDMRVLRGLASRGLVEIVQSMVGPVFQITDAGRVALGGVS